MSAKQVYTPSEIRMIADTMPKSVLYCAKNGTPYASLVDGETVANMLRQGADSLDGKTGYKTARFVVEYSEVPGSWELSDDMPCTTREEAYSLAKQYFDRYPETRFRVVEHRILDVFDSSNLTHK